MKVLGSDVIGDDIIEELLLRSEIIDKLVALDTNIRSRNPAAIMSSLSDLLMTLSNAR